MEDVGPTLTSFCIANSHFLLSYILKNSDLEKVLMKCTGKPVESFNPNVVFSVHL